MYCYVSTCTFLSSPSPFVRNTGVCLGHQILGKHFGGNVVRAPELLLGEEGLKLLHHAAEKYDLATISEAMSPEQVDLVEEYCDIIQVGARNMQNYDLLRRVGPELYRLLPFSMTSLIGAAADEHRAA